MFHPNGPTDHGKLFDTLRGDRVALIDLLVQELVSFMDQPGLAQVTEPSAITTWQTTTY